MRISHSQQYDAYTRRIQDAFGRFMDVQRQMTTGKKYASPSENPIASQQSLNIRSLRLRVDQFQTNLHAAKGELSMTESVLGEIATLTNQAYTFAVQGANDALDPGAISGIIDQVQTLQDRLVRLSNEQRSDGTYLFSGHLAETKPFTINAGAIQFNGDNEAILAEVRPAEYMRVNLSDAEGLITDLYNELEALKTNLQNGDVITLSQESVGNLRLMSGQVTQTRADVGAKLQKVQHLTQENQRRTDDLTKDLSEVEEVDLAETFVKYQQAQNSYQAALQVASQGMNLSLMDFIR